MRRNNTQLRIQARELALRNDVITRHPRTHRFWHAFKRDMLSLQSFAVHLSRTRVLCAQSAEDWLVDHIAFIQVQSQALVRQMPRRVFQRLPLLREQRMPRIYAICDDYLKHTEGHYDPLSFEQYLEAYQEVSVLTTLECWLFPAMMRLVIIRRLAENMQEVRLRHEACARVNAVLTPFKLSSPSHKAISAALNDMVRKRNLSSAEVVHLVRHLNEWEPEMTIVRDWLSTYVDSRHMNLEALASFERQFASHLQVIVGDLVTSLHAVERQPWYNTFVKISRVDKIFREDFHSGYSRLDRSSQDLLRNQVEKIANRLHLPETLIAQRAIDMAQSMRKGTPIHGGNETHRHAHPAYYLLDPQGIRQLLKDLSRTKHSGWHPALTVRLHAFPAYALSLTVLFMGLMVAASFWITHGSTFRDCSWIIILVILSLPVSEWALTLVHMAIMRGYPTRLLLRYDFSTRVPGEARTMVVMPVIWSQTEDVDDVIGRLEVHFLANRQPHIHFAILADFEDRHTETTPEDQKLVTYALSQVNRLRQKYGSDRFFLLHRSRRFNPSEGVFMGWERKRGKLVELVELLSGHYDTSFTTIHGNTEIFRDIHYVLTIDHDTILPIGAVARLIGTIHFPYNRPRLNAKGSRVIEGFGLLEPRIAVSYDAAHRSLLGAIWAGEPGIDPYTMALSHPYQNLFGEATFVGKGIFDVQAFLKTVVERVPDNAVLSHDLLEGGFLRTGLTPDIEVIEDHPSSFYSYQRRSDRWIRGDWQLLPWLGPWYQNRRGRPEQVDLSPLTRWQIFDNLRRSLVAPALFLIALFSLSILPGHPDVWEEVVLLTLFLPLLQAALGNLWRGVRWKQIKLATAQSLVQFMTLPFIAIGNMMAIWLTLYRLLVSRRHLLEWVPASKTNRGKDYHIFIYEPQGKIAIVLFGAWAWWVTSPRDHVIGTILPAIWLLSGVVIRYMSRPLTVNESQWIQTAKPELASWAQQIWSFFEHYVTEEESWLPPDNVQFLDNEVISHRTSPTNIGLYLASVVAARDLDFIDTPLLIKLLDSTLETLMVMEKWHGHLFNWYDTQRAKPLEPRYVSTVDSGNFVAYLMVVQRSLLERRQSESSWARPIHVLEEKIEQLIAGTDFRVLFSADEHLFTIGYSVNRNQRDSTLYDLLASESRQTSFIAIALGQIPVSHWFALGRPMSVFSGRKTLLSWSGSMFEYFLPHLILRTYKPSLWDSTCRGAVDRQRQYAAQWEVPFGISESGYYSFDYQWNYQYHAFGVPGLGMDPHLDEDLVVAPYATIMALPYANRHALNSLAQLETLGAKGVYGFYEALDFTRRRLPPGDACQVIQSFMAHHQGMSLLTLVNLLRQNVMIERMHREPHVRAADLLLQEKVPDNAAITSVPLGLAAGPDPMANPLEKAFRRFNTIDTTAHINTASNGRLTSVIEDDGSGFLRFRGIDVTRWRPDPLISTSGQAVYLHDVETDQTWSVSRYPTRRESAIETTFRVNHTHFEGRYQALTWQLDVTVHPDLNAEIRKLTISNESQEMRTIEITSFLELSLARPQSDQAHSAYSKLFVETFYDPDQECLFAHRRSGPQEKMSLWAGHRMYISKQATPYEFETDRGQFLGRNHTLAAPQAINRPLTESQGAVGDPAFIMRRRIKMRPGESLDLYFVTAVGESRAQVSEIIQWLKEPSQVEQGFRLAAMRSHIDLHYMALTADQALDAQDLASCLLFPAPLSKLRQDAIAQNSLSQSGLWSLGISGDIPIVVVSLANFADMPFVTLLARQLSYLEKLGTVSADLVILQESEHSPQDTLEELKNRIKARGTDTIGHITAFQASKLPREITILLRAAAMVWLNARGPRITTQLHKRHDHPLIRGISHRSRNKTPKVSHDKITGEFFNGRGAFVEDGRAYHLTVQKSRPLNRPWSNVLANPAFGTLVTELGTGYTWGKNAREFKLTPWSNDPILDPPGECLYLRDLDTQKLWSATPSPAGGSDTFYVTHGFGFTRIEKRTGELTHKMETIVPPHDSVKFIRLQLHNHSKRAQKIAVSYYAQWVLGVHSERESPFVITWWDDDGQILMARNTYQETFRDQIAFLHMAAPIKNGHDLSWTGDREEFIGREGSLEEPVALTQERLSGHVGAFRSSCGAVQRILDLPPGTDVSLVILMGSAPSSLMARDIVSRLGHETLYQEIKHQVTQNWNNVTSQVSVNTPERAMDLMLNGWLLYQTLSSRLWARTAFYQAGGAFGFRDQLQDALSLLHADSSIARDQILLHAAHQYEEGDVQHWWHEEIHKGIRTRISDDLLWLPYAVMRYWEHTQDVGIFNITVPYLHSSPLSQGENERYENTQISDKTGTLLDHCLRAIFHALHFGRHGIPLIGTGDWNDGMNQVGLEGRGESVWLGWFLVDVLKRFVNLSRSHPGMLKVEMTTQFEEIITSLETHINHFAWDGKWFRRAYTDYGRWLGTEQAEEGRIDAIVQSWAVISQGTSKLRQHRAMQSFDRELVDRDWHLARLLTPGFDQTPKVGYIQAYPPGIRENGGQYTHGAVWSIIAWTMLGREDKAWELFSLMNPILRTASPFAIERYQNEPYVMSADVYSAHCCPGRAGWSWYTGSASWMYQAGLEAILGIKRRGHQLFIQPCVPRKWQTFTLNYRFHSATYCIEVKFHNANRAESQCVIDGVQHTHNGYLTLLDDGLTHKVTFFANRGRIARRVADYHPRKKVLTSGFPKTPTS